MEWLVDLGYFGLFLGTLLAGTIIPFSSDFLLIGLLAAGGNPWLCLLAATLGNWLGGVINYGLGWLGRWDWLERWFKVKRETLEKQKAVVKKYGLWLALFSWLPLVGAVSVIALGFYKVKPFRAIVLILVGCFLRFLVWTLLYITYADRFIEWITR